MAVHKTLDPEIRGDTFRWVFVVTPEDAGDTMPDLEECVITCTVGSWTGSTETTGVELTDAPAGEVTVTIPASETANFTPGFYSGDLQVKVTANGETRTPITFRLSIKADVST